LVRWTTKYVEKPKSPARFLTAFPGPTDLCVVRQVILCQASDLPLHQAPTSDTQVRQSAANFLAAVASAFEHAAPASSAQQRRGPVASTDLEPGALQTVDQHIVGASAGLDRLHLCLSALDRFEGAQLRLSVTVNQAYFEVALAWRAICDVSWGAFHNSSWGEGTQ
jgi:hypothetical protein